MTEITPNTIWSSRQNLPELVVRDCIKEFGLTEEQADKLRFILMNRGINKSLWARRLFIKLKHQVKERLKEEHEAYKIEKQLNMTICALTRKQLVCFLSEINAEMQHIAKMPRYIIFPKTITHNWKNIEKEIIIKGRHC